jgi:competence protein ComEA
VGQQKWRKLVNRFKWYDFLAIFLVILGLVMVVISFWRGRGDSEVSVEYLAAGGEEKGEAIWVDVAGAVVRPGVYQLSEDGRLKDALAAAGGLSAEADREYVERKMNMAEKLKDGQKIFVQNNTLGGITQSEANSENQYSDGVSININNASAAELDSLWGIGEARATAIIEGRPYSSVEELVSKAVVPKNVFEKIKDKISVY